MQSVRDRDRSPPAPLGMWLTSHGQCPRGGGACECPRVGVFFNFLRADDVTRTMSKGGWVLVNVQEWGCFSISRRADDVTRTMSKGGVCACECLHPPFRKSCIRACVPPIQVQTPPPPHTHLDGWLRACIGLINSTPASRAHAICLGESTKVNLNTGSGAREP